MSCRVVCVVVRHDRDLLDSGCVSTSTAVDQEAVDADEGIGESETDVASTTDADAVSAVSSDLQHPSSVSSSTVTQDDSRQRCDVCSCDTDLASADSMPPADSTRQQAAADCLVDTTTSEYSPDSVDCVRPSSQTFDVAESSSVIDQGCVADAVELALVDDESGSYDASKSMCLTDDDPALSEDSGGSSQTLSVTQSLSLNDDDQGSLTDVTETPHSDDSGSSRTVEVGDDDVPQLLDDDDVDTEASSLVPETGELSHNHRFFLL